MASRRKSRLSRTGWVASAALIVAALAGITIALTSRQTRAPRADRTLPHDVYVWQRSWSPAVQEAVARRGPKFGQIVVLAAEVSWKNGEAKVARVRPDVDALRAANRPVGI